MILVIPILSSYFFVCQDGGGDSDRKEHTLCSVKPVTVFVEYTTFLDDEDDKSPQ